MAKGHFKPNQRAFIELRNSAEVQAALLQVAGEIAARAEGLADDPGGFEFDVRPGKTRAHAVTRAVTGRAVGLCKSKNVLIKAVR